MLFRSNLNEFLDLLKTHRYKHIGVQLIQSSEMDKIGLLKGENPIFIIRGVKGND